MIAREIAGLSFTFLGAKVVWPIPDCTKAFSWLDGGVVLEERHRRY